MYRSNVIGLVLLVFAVSSNTVGLEAAGEIQVEATFAHGPQQPATVPILPGLNIGRSIFSGGGGKPVGEPRYTPVGQDSYGIHNGGRAFNHLLTWGVWHLRVGDRPRIRLTHRGENGVYALPGLLPALGVAGDLRVQVEAAGQSKWLDEFETIDAVLSPGSAEWTCSDSALGLRIRLSTVPFEEYFGYGAEAQVEADSAAEVKLRWVFEGTKHVADKDGYAEFATGTYTQIFVGLTDAKQRVEKGKLESELAVSAGEAARSQFICVWGYKDYDHAGVEAAYQRLEYKPFADVVWLAQMKEKWFNHWIGKGLEAEKKFVAVRGAADEAIAKARVFEQAQRSRVRITTPDERFDVAMNNCAATLRKQFEYPAFIHGVSWTKYGKINSGYYGCDTSGYHDEVKDSLLFLSGTLDHKGRSRYFEPTFAISHWSEEQNFYFVEQVWYHYRWTGDLAFLKAMWPSVQRVLEQGIFASDPDGDGILTAYYETWNGDTHARGGKCALWTGMAQAALEAAVSMGKICGGRYYEKINAGGVSQNPDPPVVAEYYAKLLARTKKGLDEQLWNKEIGAYSSADWNGLMRPHPEAMEQNYHIWRGVGSPVQQYMAMRYIRENLEIETAPGVVIELMSDWWPVMWSHHYVANGDTMSSVASGCKAGDADGFWPAMKSVAETAYNSDTATIYHGMANDGTGRGMNLLAELEPMVMMAVIDGMFGAQPYFGENLLVLRPNLPSAWGHAAIELADFSYAYKKDAESLSMQVKTPVDRKVRVELPATGQVQAVKVNGQPADYKLESAVNSCRVVVEAAPGREFLFEVEQGDAAVVEGDLLVIQGERATFSVSGAKVVKIHDPQEMMSNVAVAGDGGEARLTAAGLGKITVFLELEAGKGRWLHALDLDVRKPWTIMEKSLALHNGGPKVAAPAVDVAKKSLTLEIENNKSTSLTETARVCVGGESFEKAVQVGSRGRQTITVDLSSVWARLTPGTVAVDVSLNGVTQRVQAVNWQIGKEDGSGFAGRLKQLDLSKYYNIEITKIYGRSFKWRHDYAGCGVGIDWRDPVPICDAKGYWVSTWPIDQFEYQTIPEGYSRTASYTVDDFAGPMETPFGVDFSIGSKPVADGAQGNMMALVTTEPYEQLPSEATLTMPEPMQLEKLYLLTANLTKTVKSYFPAAEVVVHYANGDEQVEELVPPHTMSCFGQKFCPRAYAIPFGNFAGDLTPLRMGGAHPHLAVTDIVLDPTRKVREIELRCVTSEAVFGIMGLTVLQAE